MVVTVTKYRVGNPTDMAAYETARKLIPASEKVVEFIAPDPEKLQDWIYLIHYPEGVTSGDMIFATSVIAGVAGDAAANGTTIVTYSLAAGKKLIVTRLTIIGSASAQLNLVTGTLAAQTIVHPFYVAGPGSIELFAEKDAPIAIVNNSGGSVALPVLLVVPLTFAGVGNNNAATKYFHAALGGLVI